MKISLKLESFVAVGNFWQKLESLNELGKLSRKLKSVTAHQTSADKHTVSQDSSVSSLSSLETDKMRTERHRTVFFTKIRTKSRQWTESVQNPYSGQMICRRSVRNIRTKDRQRTYSRFRRMRLSAFCPHLCSCLYPRSIQTETGQTFILKVLADFRGEISCRLSWKVFADFLRE